MVLWWQWVLLAHQEGWGPWAGSQVASGGLHGLLDALGMLTHMPAGWRTHHSLPCIVLGKTSTSEWASCSAGHIHLRLTAGQGPVASGEVVAPLPVVMVAAGAGSGSDWTPLSGMGSGRQLQLKKRRTTSGLTR